MRRGPPVGDDFAVGEGGGAGDMVEMPVAEHDRKSAHASGLQLGPDEAGMVDRNMRVVDQRLVALDQRIAGNAERQRAIVDPVGPFGKPVVFDAAVIEGEDAAGRVEDAQMPGDRAACRIGLLDICAELRR